VPDFTDAELAQMKKEHAEFHSGKDTEARDRCYIQILIALGIPCDDIKPKDNPFALFFLMDRVFNDVLLENIAQDTDILEAVRKLTPEQKLEVRQRIGR
jgi:hypothetical protein